MLRLVMALCLREVRCVCSLLNLLKLDVTAHAPEPQCFIKLPGHSPLKASHRYVDDQLVRVLMEKNVKPTKEEEQVWEAQPELRLPQTLLMMPGLALTFPGTRPWLRSRPASEKGHQAGHLHMSSLPFCWGDWRHRQRPASP